MIEVLSPAELERAEVSGKFIGDTLRTLRERTRVGTNLMEIDAWTHELIDAAGAESCYVDYAPSFGSGPFGHYICTSVNDAVLHGMPRKYRLKDGDLLSLDLACSLHGIVADAAISFVVGTPKSDEDLRMIEATEAARAAGIAEARVGNKIGDISHAIGEVLRGYGYPVNTDFGGHGVGSTMHQDPHIPNDGRPGRGYKLREGLLLAIEPWVMAGTDQLVTDKKDGWTLRSKTGSRTAHSEHTVAITADGPKILTA
ncbi:type I methionyl aminopeptidase [Brevibacterium sp. 91QC2O2]|uniref:type I methionyl aminopeptidase n=1 Tax=Brevibacterium TaxID=1696 RepID=UPI00211CF693|nr:MULTISPECIES: type I methionyl aminopeptidase [unclassified Brevibacterium]MCQ9368226.1 type I methionyl aminopeptidase [Brevibacterium sp. 91QC2O2]MCQ9385564.1 type I methionyl aminopeptidase [Brevibacterium sp. 68QC2CO]